jgi:hypothetical protein
VEPTIPFTLEPSDGHSYLILSPKIPLFGQQHFRIKATLNTPGISVSVPKLIPESGKAEKIKTKNFVILPRYADNEIITWNLNRLETVDDVTQKQLEEKTLKLPEENKISVSGTILAAPEGITSPTGTVQELTVHEPVSDTNARLFLQTIGDGTEEFTATITRKNSLSVVNLYDMNIFIKDDGVLFGNAIIDLKSRGQDNFILQMPKGYELISVTCADIVSKGIRLSDERWQIDLWSSDYPQRIKIMFRGQLIADGIAAQPLTLSKLNKEKLTMSLRFPVLEGVLVQQTLWTISFETPHDDIFLPFDVSVRYNREEQIFSNVLHGRIPVSGNKAMQMLLRFNLIRLNNLLLVLNSVSAPPPARLEEIKRWYIYWSDEWFSTVNEVEYQTKNFPSTLQSSNHELIFDPTNLMSDESVSGFIGTILESKNIPMSIEALMQRYQNETSAKFFSTVSENNHSRPQLFFSDLPFFERNNMSKDISYFFGANEESLSEICLTSKPINYYLPFFLRNKLLNHLLLGLAVMIFLLILAIRFHVWELFFQFPHFCGFAVGLILWSLFPSGFLGIAVFFLTFLSFCYPVWSRHRKFFEQKTTNDSE